MANKQDKAKKLVAGAVGTFTKAITEVEKANVILAEAIESDVKEMEHISSLINDLYVKLDEVQAGKLNKQAEVIQNKELIAKLEKFTK